MTRAFCVGVDVGTTNVKAALVAFDARGRVDVIARASAGHPTRRPVPGHAEQATGEWWKATVEALRALGAQRGRATAVSVSGQGSTFTLCGPHGEDASPAIGWQDVRAADDAADLDRRLRGQLDRAHGNRTGDAPEPKLRWLAARRAQPLPGDVRAVTAAAWVQAALGGDATISEADAGTWMSWNRHERAWDPALAESLGVAAVLPPVAHTGSAAGRLSPAAAHATGLSEGAALITGTSDLAAAAVSAGVGRPGEVSYSKGTGAFACCHVKPVSDPGPLLGVPAISADVMQLCGAANTVGAAWDWARRLLGSLDQATAEGLAMQSGPAVPAVVPWLAGAAHPVVEQRARAAFAQLSLETRPGDLLRGVLEGTAAALGEQLAVARRLAGHGFDLVVSTGGPTASRLWNRLDAAAAEAPVVVAPVSDAAVGGALIAAQAAGLVSSALECGRSLRAGGPVFEPEAALVERARRLATQLEPVQALALALTEGNRRHGRPA